MTFQIAEPWRRCPGTLVMTAKRISAILLLADMASSVWIAPRCVGSARLQLSGPIWIHAVGGDMTHGSHKHEHVLLVGTAGVGKRFRAQALGYAAVRAGHAVRFVHADSFFKAMSQARVDNSVDRTIRSFLAPDLLILDDLGLHRLTAQQSADLYELILNRHRVSSFIITSNRAVEEWLSIFDGPILGNSKPMPVVRAVQMRLTHLWPLACKLTVSRVARTEADQGLVRIARATAWPGSLATALLVTLSRGIPFRRL